MILAVATVERQPPALFGHHNPASLDEGSEGGGPLSSGSAVPSQTRDFSRFGSTSRKGTRGPSLTEACGPRMRPDGLLPEQNIGPQRSSPVMVEPEDDAMQTARTFSSIAGGSLGSRSGRRSTGFRPDAARASDPHSPNHSLYNSKARARDRRLVATCPLPSLQRIGTGGQPRRRAKEQRCPTTRCLSMPRIRRRPGSWCYAQAG